MSIEGQQIRTQHIGGDNFLRDVRRARVIDLAGTPVTLAVDQMSRSLIQHTPAALGVLNTPTAAQFVGANKYDRLGPFVGAGTDFFLRAIGFATTLTAAAGVTIVGGNVVTAGNIAHFLVRLDNVTAGAEAVTITNLCCLSGGQLSLAGTTFGCPINAATAGWPTALTLPITLTAALMLEGFIQTTGTDNITTDTAANIIAALPPGANTPGCFMDVVIFPAAGTGTLVAGTGVTINGTAAFGATATWRFAVTGAASVVALRLSIET